MLRKWQSGLIEKVKIIGRRWNLIKNRLIRSWAQHDGQWSLKTSRKHGYKEANRLNQEALFTMAKIEARYVLNALYIKRDLRLRAFNLIL